MVNYICYNWMPAIAKHVIDLPENFYTAAGTSRMHDSKMMNPLEVRDGEIVFVKTDFIIQNIFQQDVLSKIFRRFNLITGISSYQIGKDYGYPGIDSINNYKILLDHPNLNKWICTNPPDIASDKIIPIPIGFEEPDRPGGNQEFLERMQKERISFRDKKDMILLPYHAPGTNPKREVLINLLKSLDFVYAVEEKQDVEEYFKTLDQYKFVIGLEGSGPDIHRNYETMLVGSIPINIENVVKRVFDFHSAEAVFLKSWSDLDEKKFKQILQMEYNTDNNDKFLELENHISLIRSLV